MSNTPNYSLIKPDIRSTGWGDDLNSNFDTIDLKLKENADAVAGIGDVTAPATNTGDKVPQWDGNNSKTLKDGLAVGTSANNLVQLDGSAKLPAVDGSNLTNLPGGSVALDDVTDVTITSAEQGDILYRNASGWVNLHHGTDGQYLKSRGNAADPEWGTVSAGASATELAFVNADLSTGVLTVTHSKGLAAGYTALVTVVNNSGAVVIPDAINTFATNSFKVDLTSFGTLTGTWYVIYITK